MFKLHIITFTSTEKNLQLEVYHSQLTLTDTEDVYRIAN